MEYLFQNYIRKSSYRNIVLKHFCNTAANLFLVKRNDRMPVQETGCSIPDYQGEGKTIFISNDGVERTILLLAKGDIFGK